MDESRWRCFPNPGDPDALRRAVLQVHRRILDTQLAGDPLINPDLPIQVRALRTVERWQLLLLLTPWMLARLLFPERPPGWELPEDWSPDARRDAPYQVLGPRQSWTLLGQPQTGHLNYDPDLGHYLLQPLCLDMRTYPDGEAVFEAWNRVIRTRDENMKRARRDCPLQREISRREFFRRLRNES